MGRVTGFEPATSNTTNWRSNQLSYTRHKHLMASSPTMSKGNTTGEFLLQHSIIIEDIGKIKKNVSKLMAIYKNVFIFTYFFLKKSNFECKSYLKKCEA